MATVRQSITALYEESRKSAADGVAMMAVINTTPVADLAMDPSVDAPGQPEIVARFDELRRLAEIEADHVEDSAGVDLAGVDLAGVDGAGVDGAGELTSTLTGFDDDDHPAFAMDPDESDQIIAEPDITPPSFAGPSGDGPSGDGPSGAAAAETSDHVPSPLPSDVLPSTPLDLDPGNFEAGNLDAGNLDAVSLDENVDNGRAADLALPEEPPAPASTLASGDGDDLEIGDIQELVRQAWEDEAGIGQSVPQAGTSEQTASDDTASAVPTDIELAMEEIAAAVVQSGDTATPVDVEAMKAEIIAAMRSEMKALLDADLTSAVRAAVAEAVKSALAEMQPVREEADKAETKPATATKAKEKAAPKKAPGARKASAKKAAAKRVASKKAAVVKKLRADPAPDPDDA